MIAGTRMIGRLDGRLYINLCMPQSAKPAHMVSAFFDDGLLKAIAQRVGASYMHQLVAVSSSLLAFILIA